MGRVDRGDTERTSHKTWSGRVVDAEHGAVVTWAVGQASHGRAELGLNFRECTDLRELSVLVMEKT